MIFADLDASERLHLAVALRDRARALRRNGQQLPPRLADLADALMRPGAASGGQDYGRGAAGPDDGQRTIPSVLMDGPAAAARLGCSARTLRRVAASGDVASVLVNGRRRYRPADLEAYVAALPPGKRAKAG